MLSLDPTQPFYSSDNYFLRTHTPLALKSKDEVVARLKKLSVKLEAAQKAAKTTVAEVQKAQRASKKALRVVDSADRRKGRRRGKKYRAK